MKNLERKINTVNKMRNQKYHCGTCSTVPKSNQKKCREANLIRKTHIHDRSLAWLGSDTSL